MDELAALAVWAETFLGELDAGSGLVFDRNGVPGSEFVFSMGEAALSGMIVTRQPKGHSFPMMKYLHISVLNLRFRSSESEELLRVLTAEFVFSFFLFPALLLSRGNRNCVFFTS